MQVNSEQIKKMQRSEFIYCRRELCGGEKCDSQCDNCEEFYKPMENAIKN